MDDLSASLRRCCKRINGINSSESNFQFLLECELKIGELPRNVSLLRDFSSASKELAIASDRIGFDGHELIDVLKDSTHRLEIAHAAIPALPADWTKPTGHALILLATCVLIYILTGSAFSRQPLWNIFGLEDGASLAFHPAFIIPVAYLILLGALAARRAVTRSAENTVNAIMDLLDGGQRLGKSLSKEDIVIVDAARKSNMSSYSWLFDNASANTSASNAHSAVLDDFAQTTNHALCSAIALCALLTVLGWWISWNYGGSIVEPAPNIECVRDARVFSFSRGFLSHSKAKGSQLVYTSDPTTVLCWKPNSVPALATSTTPVADVIIGSSDSAPSLENFGGLADLGRVATALETLRIPTLAAPTVEVNMDGISLSIEGLKSCQSDANSGTCVLAPITQRLNGIELATRNLELSLSNIDDNLLLVSDGLAPLRALEADIESALTDWRDIRSRHIFSRTGNVLLGESVQDRGHSAQLPPKGDADAAE